MYTYRYTYAYIHTYIFTYIYTYIYLGLEIGGFALPNANHFWDKCESLWPTDLQ